MTDLVEFLEAERGKQSPEAFANEIGIRYASYHGYLTGSKTLGVKNARQIAKYYASKGEWEKVYLVASVLLDLDLSPTV